jgi:hypothetical protein
MAHDVEAVEDDLRCRSGPVLASLRHQDLHHAMLAAGNAQIYLEQVTVQMPPPLLLDMVVVRQFLRAVLARLRCVLRVLGPHFHALSVDVQVHAG